MTDCTYDVTGLIEGTSYHFRVSAENTAGTSPASESIGPIVPKTPTTPLRFLKQLEDAEAKVEDRVTLTCEVNKDNTDAQWFKDDLPLKINDKFKAIRDGRRHQLVISDVKLEDEAQYSCKVKQSLKFYQTINSIVKKFNLMEEVTLYYRWETLQPSVWCLWKKMTLSSADIWKM